MRVKRRGVKRAYNRLLTLASDRAHPADATDALELNIGMFGTFDVENFGDLLFPLIAEAELARRLGRVRITRYSYGRRTASAWPYEVTSLSELPREAFRLDGILLGGGHIIRFDKHVAPGYGPPSAAIHHPTGYWLTPALVALGCGLPIAWNAPGVVDEIPAWADPMLRLVLAGSRYVAVRDESSRQTLERMGSGASIAVVPDTAFGVAKLLDANGPSKEFLRIRDAANLNGPYILVQARPDLKGFVRAAAPLFGNHRLLVLPIGPINGDDDTMFEDEEKECGVARLKKWPHPLLLAELIAQARGVVGGSLHLGISALAFGVPVFRPADVSGGKYEALSVFKTVYPFDPNARTSAEWFMERLGRTDPEPDAQAAVRRLEEHWDRVAGVFRAGRERTPASVENLSRFWQALPGRSEASALREADLIAALAESVRQLGERQRQLTEQGQWLAERERLLREDAQRLAEHERRFAEQQHRLTDQERQLTEQSEQLSSARRGILARDERIAALEASTSWRVTAPFRSISRRLRRRPGIVDIDRIEQQTLSSEPYRWGSIGELFSRRDAAALANSFPRDHFKTVAGYDGEKGFEYEARCLIGMGAEGPSHVESLSPAWRRLADDLLSPPYRAAMSRLTGCDISGVPIEVNVFHYGPAAWLGPHVDLRDKLATHVLYFNRTWDRRDGGCLTILKSSNAADVVAEIEPRVGNSSVVVRSDRSWHAVSRVADGCPESRRSMTVTFYRPGSVSTMWPPGDTTPLHAVPAVRPVAHAH